MTTLSLQIPLVGQPNSTEDPKIASDMTAIVAWANGSIDDSNLANPNNGVRRLLLQTTATLNAGATAGDYLLAPGGVVLSGGTTAATGLPPIWVGDQGLSGQPTDWQVAGKSAYCRVRLTAAVNGVAAVATFTGKLYQITGVTGSGSLAFTFSALAGSSTSVLTASTGGVSAVESPQFAMPLTNAYALGVGVTGTVAANSIVAITAQLYGYNA